MASVALLCVMACAKSQLGNATELAAPYVDAFSRYDRWARRAWDSAGTTQHNAVLNEQMFAPLRNDEDVHAVWIARLGEPTLQRWSWPNESMAEPAVAWTQLRHPLAGELGVGSLAVCPERAPTSKVAATACVLITRDALDAYEKPLRVTVAYRMRDQ